MKNPPYIKNMEEWRTAFSFSIPIKIRFSETDMFGHVNNVSPFIYFEEGRIEFFKAIELFAEDSSPDAGIPVVADLQCDYHKQMHFGHDIELYIKVHDTGLTSFDLHYLAIDHQGDTCLTGRGRVVQINPATGKSMVLSQETKQKLTSLNH